MPTELNHYLNRSVADVAAECDRIRADVGMPDYVLLALLDSMFSEVTKVRKWSDRTRVSVVGKELIGTI